MQGSNGNGAVHPLLAKIKERSTKLERYISQLEHDEISCEKANNYARLFDADSRQRAQTLKEAIFDAKHHPERSKPCFADQ